jgi:hypothetical protein
VAHERERAEFAEQERTRLLSIIEDLETRITAIEARADAADEDRRLAEARADAAVSRAIADQRRRERTQSVEGRTCSISLSRANAPVPTH